MTVVEDLGVDAGVDVPIKQDVATDAAPDVTDTAPVDAGCHSNPECDDEDNCTTDTCDLASGRCTTVRVEGCCTTMAQCDDGNACTMDSCGAGNRCTNAVIPGCCTTTAQCDDTNRCTRDECVSGRCQTSAVAGCCTMAAQCVDSSPCTVDTCNMSTNLCEHTAMASCCTSEANCIDGNACTTDTCASGMCSNQPVVGCCTSDLQCDDLDACTADRCNASACEHPRVEVAGDHCTNAVALTLGSTVQTRQGDSTACATSDTSGNNDLVYTAVLGAGNYVVYADTYGSDFDTRLSLRDGCGGAEILSSNNQCGRTQSQLVTVIPGGRTVSLVVGGANPTDRGNVVLHYLVAAVPTGFTYLRAEPAMNATTARALSGNTGNFFRGCAAGTNASDALRPSCARDGTGPEQVWVSATCPGVRAFTASTCDGTGFDTIVSVLVPGATARVLACNDDSCGFQSRASGSTPEAASPVFVVVDGFYSNISCGDYRLQLSNFYY